MRKWNAANKDHVKQMNKAIRQRIRAELLKAYGNIVDAVVKRNHDF